MVSAVQLRQMDIQTQLDEAVLEVFGMMLGLSCHPIDTVETPATETVTAVVGLAGALSGACVLRAETRAAVALAGFLSGSTIDELDDTVKDAVGELCNMLAGAWKGRFPEIAGACMLAVPAVVTGSNYTLHLQRPGCRLERFYQCGEHLVSLSLLIEGAGFKVF